MRILRARKSGCGSDGQFRLVGIGQNGQDGFIGHGLHSLRGYGATIAPKNLLGLDADQYIYPVVLTWIKAGLCCDCEKRDSRKAPG
jgi:hypothetical protein